MTENLDPFANKEEAEAVQQKAIDERDRLFKEIQNLERANVDIPEELNNRFETLFEVTEPKDASEN